MSDFNPNAFLPIELKDREYFDLHLLLSYEQSCEFNFTNLFIWNHTSHAKWQVFKNRIYLHMKDEAEKLDMLAFISDSFRGEPEPFELAEISDAMRAAGYSGSFQHVRDSYIQNNLSELEKYFIVEPMPDSFSEYIHEVESLAELHGTKLAKKRNLIAQFKRNHPDARVEQMTASMLPEVLKLAEEWRAGMPEPESPFLKAETIAENLLAEHFSALDVTGLAVFIEDKMIAFEMCSRINRDMYTEHFEKSLHEYKGASQFINNEMAKFLLGKCKYLNREQDLGMPGLHQAKLSYEPEFMLKNYTIRRK